MDHRKAKRFGCRKLRNCLLNCPTRSNLVAPYRFFNSYFLCFTRRTAAIIEDHTDRQMRLRTILLFILNGSLIALALLNPKLTIYAYLALPILDFFLPSHKKLIKKIKR